jgi:hypothetical protein
MNASFWGKFLFHKTPASLLDAKARGRIEEAILEGDPARFRLALAETCPELVGARRLYGVLAMTPRGIGPILVDETGKRLGAGDVLEAGVPIDLVNVEFTSTEIRAKIGGQLWRVPREAPRAEQNP